jgi:FtsH-binding integral membrane protein
VYPYFAIGLFSVLTAVDTQAAVAEYERGTADHLWHAAGFYLNFLNLFSALTRIIRDVIGD